MSGRRVIGVLNGPNLNLLGEREPELYGTDTLTDLHARCVDTAAGLGFEVDFRQTNHEGVLIDQVHELRTTVAGLVVNAAALSHTSIAVRDALATVESPVVEVHLTNLHRREDFRHRSHVSGVADAVIVGCGPAGYDLALQQVARLVARRVSLEGRGDLVHA